MNIRIRLANFEYSQDNRFYLNVNRVTGYGFVNPSTGELLNNINFPIIGNNILVTGQILNPTGFQPAIFYKTGILSGTVPEGQGFFTWTNVNLVDSGVQGKVYLNYITGQTQAKNTIEFINNTGSGLLNGDLINLNGVSFIYSTNKTPNNFLQFNSPQDLVNILNSGSTGAFNSNGFSLLENIVGITGHLNNNRLELFSLLKKGEDGNRIRIYRDTQNLDAVKIHSRYFTGGQSLRPLTNTWTGTFTNSFSEIQAENSGIYIRNEFFDIFGRISGVSWVDNFSGNYTITTGLSNPNLNTFTTSRVPFKNNVYFGTGIIPKAQFTISSGLKIEILKLNPYNISGNLAKYTFSGDGFLFSGIIEG
jgi:hypothetical protein